MAHTRSQVIQSLGEAMGDLLMGQATSGTSTTLVDTSDDSPFSAADSVNRYNGHSLYVYSGPNAGVERRVSSFTPGTRTLTVADSVSGAYSPSDYYELHGLAPRSVKVKALNRVLTELLLRRVTSPLGLLADGDGDMEATGTTAWTGSNATLAKETDENDFVFSGTQSLKVTALAANAYAESQDVLVLPETTYHVAIVVLPWYSGANESAPKLVVYDQDNGAAITLDGEDDCSYAADGSAWQRLSGSFTTPVGCARITFRLTEQTSGAISYWGDLTLVQDGQRHYQLPSWCDRKGRLWEIVRRSGDVPAEFQYHPLRDWRADFQSSGGAAPMVTVSSDGWGEVLIVRGARNYDSLDSDDAETTAPLALVRAATAVELLQTLATGRKHTDQAALERDLVRWNTRLKSEWQRYSPRRVRRLRFPEIW